ncbi:MAG: PTS transporter subunit IIC [Lawsonibacter sp.]|nr:PTS transporter subunit IIC [Lawsonibacter sp.]
MSVLSSVFQNLLDMGSAVVIPIVLLIIGLIVGLKPARAFSAALTLGVALTGINLIIGYMSDTVGTAAQSFVNNTGLQLTGLDMGWAPALGLCWTWSFAFLMFPVQIGVNVVMLVLGWTDCLNVDMWNVGNQIFTAYLVYCVTGNPVIAFLVAVAQIVLELKNADATKHQLTELTGVPGVAMPHPMFLSNIFFYPFCRLLDKILPKHNPLNAERLRAKLGVFGENHVIGFIVGTIIGLVGGYGKGSFLLGVQAGTALMLFPMVSKLFMTALTPIADQAQKFVKQRFPGRDLVIGLDWPVLAGNAEIWVAIILTIPVALVVSMALPGNTVLPFGNLMNVCVCAAVFMAAKGDLIKMLITSYIMVPILCWSASDFAPMLTKLATAAGTQLAAGQDMAWWGMDIAEIRWIVVECFRGQPLAFAGLAAFIVLAIFYFKWQKAEEQNALDRMNH